MKLGADAVLLGAWAPVDVVGNTDPHLLDIGTGSGILALMLAQRFPDAFVEAIDNEPNAVIQAQENFQNAPFRNRLQATCIPLQSFEPEEQFDAIICNPPFFPANEQIANLARKLARQMEAMSFDDLFLHSTRLLKPNGTLSIIRPCHSMVDAICCPAQNTQVQQFWLKEAVAVFSSPNATQPTRVLQHYVNAQPSAPRAPTLSRLFRETPVHDALLTDFYL